MAYTLFALRAVDPALSPLSVVSRLLLHDAVPMLLIAFVAWTAVMAYQHTFSGMDMGLRFEWLGCRSGTRVGGFEWTGC